MKLTYSWGYKGQCRNYYKDPCVHFQTRGKVWFNVQGLGHRIHSCGGFRGQGDTASMV